MGHRDSSATLGRAGSFRSPGGGIGAPAPQYRAEQSKAGEMSRTARALLLAVRIYQSFFSALMPSACKFYPSCSHYAAEALALPSVYARRCGPGARCRKRRPDRSSWEFRERGPFLSERKEMSTETRS